MMDDANLKYPWHIRTAKDEASGTTGLFIENEDGEFVCDFYVKGTDGKLYPFPNAEANAAALINRSQQSLFFGAFCDQEDVARDIAAIFLNISLGDDDAVHPILESNLKEAFREIWNGAWNIAPRDDDITALRAALTKLAAAEALYRDYEQFRVSSHQLGPKAWDAMRAAGDAARKLLNPEK